MMSGYALPLLPLSEAEIAARLLALLAQHGEKASLSLGRMYELCPQQIRQCGIGREGRLQKLLEKFPRLFTLSEINGSILVRTAFQIRLCEAHCSKSGCQVPQACNALHICKFYILGTSCTFSYNVCKFGHELNTEHNLRVLQPLGIPLDQNSIQNLIRSQRSRVTCPPVCKHYNVGVGCRYGDGGRNCHALHVCKFYLQGKCTFGAKCKRSHNIFDVQPRLILEKHGIDTNRSPQEVLQEIQGANLSSPTATAPPPAAAAAPAAAALPLAAASPRRASSQGAVGGKRDDGEDKEEDDGDPLLCIYHLRGRCGYGQACKNHHGQKPYQWQFMEPDSSNAQQGWKDFSDTLNQRLEDKFCDPNIDDYNISTEASRPIQVSFQQMSMQSSSLQQSCPIRRLSTLSTVKAPPFHQFTTRWCWYWQDESGIWTEYGQANSRTSASSITSDDLETAFQQNSQDRTFKTSAHQYMLSFQRMVQINIQYRTARKIKRRPSQQGQGGSPHVPGSANLKPPQSAGTPSRAAAALGGRAPAAGPTKAATGGGQSSPAIPPHWDMDSPSDNNYYQMVEIQKAGATRGEFDKLEKLFQSTLTSHPVKAIHRIQNVELLEGYMWKKGCLERRLSAGKAVCEKLLFHGTRKEYVSAICKQGFDWRISGRSSGTSFGKGSYFARDASYSDRYTNCRKMFVVRTLVGEWTAGNATMVRPPGKNPSKPDVDLYDSCVDNIASPSVYVIFSAEQAYPEYLISY